MSRVWTSEELARECKNCEVASAGRIRSQAETIRKLRETIALMSRERSNMREDREAYEVDKADAKRKGEW